MAKEITYELKGTQIDGRVSVNYLIRENNTVKVAGLLLPAGADIKAYGEANKDALFAGGVDYPSEGALVSPVAVFEALKGRQSRAVHLKAIFSAFALLKLGGSLTDMKVSALQAYTDDEDQLATLQAFMAEYRGATEDDRNALDAIAIFAMASLITSG
jgi:hypothetical protein